jgi:multidrug efflux pump subunit AcrA (membrane-fusion protein)
MLNMLSIGYGQLFNIFYIKKLDLNRLGNFAQVFAMVADLPASQGSPLPQDLEPVTEPQVRPGGLRSGWFWRRRWWLLPVAIAPLVLGGGYLLQSRLSTDPVVEADVLTVSTLTVEAVNRYEVRRQYSGELVAQRSSDLGFERPGMVVNILVDEGDRVVVGQPLARLDVQNLEVQRQQLLAQRQEAQAQLRELQAGPRSQNIAAAEAAVGDLQQQLELARLQRDRRADLYTEGAISREELDQQSFNTSALENRLAQAQSQLDELRAGTRREQIDAQIARVAQIDAGLRQVEVDLNKSVITAPFDGRISARDVDEGVVVSGGQTVLSLVEAGDLEARVGLPTDIADTLTPGQSYPLQVGNRSVTATLTALLPELDAASRTVTATLTLSGADLTVGETVRLLLSETQPTDGFWLPSTALVPDDRGLWSVYVLGEGDETDSNRFTVTRRQVEVLYTEGDRSLVRGTLQAGDRAIVNGTHRVVVGDRVQVGGGV